MRVYTSGEMEAVNGTDARLKCSFQTSAPININALSVSWTFRPLSSGREESVSICVCVYLCLGESVIKPETSLTVSGSIHPLSRLREQLVSHRAPYGASKTAALMRERVCVCVNIENRMRNMQQVAATVLSFFLLENKIAPFTSIPRLSLV